MNNNYLDLYQLKSQHGMINGSISELKWDAGNEDREVGSGVSVRYNFTVSPDDPVTSFRYDEVILCTGWKFFDPTVHPFKILVRLTSFRSLMIRAKWKQ